MKDKSYGRHVIWAAQPFMPKTESEGKLNINLEHPSMWRFVSADTHNATGNLTSFEIMPGLTGATLLPADEWPQKRAAFSEHQLWITPYEPNERFAAGTYVSNSRGTGRPWRVDQEEPQHHGYGHRGLVHRCLPPHATQ